VNKKAALFKARLEKRESEREKERISKKAQPKIEPENDETQKIQTYFRHRVATLTKLIEERVRNNSLLKKVGKTTKNTKPLDDKLSMENSGEQVIFL